MSRSLKVSDKHIAKVKLALKRNRFARQQDLAEQLGLSLSTVSNFLNGRSVDYLNFLEISDKLGLDLQEIADFEVHVSNGSQNNWVESSDKPKTMEEIVGFSHYIPRTSIESRCYETVLQNGSLLRIKGSKRMGKTSLINCLLREVGKDNYRTAYLSLLLADGSILRGLEEFLRWLSVVISRHLGLPAMVDNYWEEELGSSYNCTIYFEEYILSQINTPLVLALDDVDLIFSTPFAGDFLAMLRAWHEKAKSKPLWQKLRLVVAHSTEVYIPLKINQSPFNVGVPIELPEFTLEQLQSLAQQQGLNWNMAQVQRLRTLVGGHPSLVQMAIHCLKNQQINFEEFLQTAFTESGVYSSHLRGHLLNLRENSQLAEAMRKVIEARKPVQLETTKAFQLQSLGLVKLEGNCAKPYCDLYTKYFQTRL